MPGKELFMDVQVENARKFSPLMLSMVTALVAAATVTLTFLGNVSHSQYFRHWGLDASLFPKTVDWMLINGYYGLTNGLISIVGAIYDNAVFLGCAVVVVGLYVFFVVQPPGRFSKGAPLWWLRQPEWFRRLTKHMSLTALFIGAPTSLLLLVTALMIIPAALGESAGKRMAQDENEEYIKGCGISKLPCVELKEGSKVVAVGFVIANSPSYIAIFDVRLRRARVIPFEKLEVVSGYLPAALEEGGP